MYLSAHIPNKYPRNQVQDFSHHHPIVQNSHGNRCKSLSQRRYGWYHLAREVSYLRLYFHHYNSKTCGRLDDRRQTEGRPAMFWLPPPWSTTWIFNQPVQLLPGASLSRKRSIFLEFFPFFSSSVRLSRLTTPNSYYSYPSTNFYRSGFWLWVFFHFNFIELVSTFT